MRILILHSRYLSGHASGENTVVSDEARLLNEGGHEVKVWEPSPSKARGLTLVRTGLQAVWSQQAFAQVAHVAQEMEADVVHCHNLFPKLSPAVVRSSLGHGVPTVMTLHNYRLMCLPASFLRDGRICEDCMGRQPWPGVIHRCYRHSLPGSAALASSLLLHRAIGTFELVTLYLPVSEFVRRKYVEAGIPPERLHVKSNFAWPTARREGSGDYFLFLGRLSSEKGVDTLLKAWSGTNARLLVVGDGPDAHALRGAAPKNVEFLTTVAQTEVADILRRARALLVPSLWYEAQPRVILEAYAAGVPVVASRIGGLPDLIADGESGLLVPPDNPIAWSQAVERLLDDDEAKRLGNGAYRQWVTQYNPERALRTLEDAYREAISRRQDMAKD
jgi:glycosyltransferase involved in cell wall biosynthesis